MWIPFSKPNAILSALGLFMILGCGASNDEPTDTSSEDSHQSSEVSEPAEDSDEVLEVPEQSEPEVISVPATKPEIDEKESNANVPSTESAPVTAQPTKPTPSKPDEKPNVDAAAELERQLSEFQIPPAWLSSVQTKWDINKPWKEARLEIRRLLGKNDEASRREGIKLTWDYLQKDDIGNRHEYGMYMFLGNEPLWAIIAYREFVERTDLDYPPYHGIHSLASLYTEYGLYEEAEEMLARGLKMSPPDAKWLEMRQAGMHDAFGDLYAAWGKLDKAKESYEEAVRLYPLGKPPYGRHLLPRRASKVQAKLDLLSQASLESASLRDGTYRETALGYSGDVKLTVHVQGGKIAKIDIAHQEKIEQNATKIIPDRIIAEQSLQIDGVTGATVTKDAIVGGTLRALQKAGLR